MGPGQSLCDLGPGGQRQPRGGGGAAVGPGGRGDTGGQDQPHVDTAVGKHRGAGVRWEMRMIGVSSQDYVSQVGRTLQANPWPLVWPSPKTPILLELLLQTHRWVRCYLVWIIHWKTQGKKLKTNFTQITTMICSLQRPNRSYLRSQVTFKTGKCWWVIWQTVPGLNNSSGNPWSGGPVAMPTVSPFTQTMTPAHNPNNPFL